MADHKPPHTPSSPPDGDGVRVIRKARTAGRSALILIALAVAVIGAVVAWRLLIRSPAPVTADIAAGGADTDANSHIDSTSTPWQTTARPPRQLASLPAQRTDMPNGDPNDLANYFRPGDPEPTGAELIGALHDVGIHTGIGAFNPPGTSPPLEGLAVPEDYPLPPGYVRHYQSTDAGVAIEPILMFAPDFRLVDANGQLVAMPSNRVVPSNLAPPGLPVRWVHIPRP